MKSSNHKMLPVQLALVCVVLLCTVFSIHGQATSSVGSTAEKIVYVTPNIAIERLNTEMEALKALMAGISTGSQVYKQLESKYAYYGSIARILRNEKPEDSEDVHNAIMRAMGIYASDAYGNVSQQQRQENRESAIDLLRL